MNETSLLKLCSCGCGEAVKNLKASFINGHHTRLKKKNIIRDYTGDNCKHCGVLLNHITHSNRSKLNKNASSYRRAWRICKRCLAKQKKKSRNTEKSNLYNKKQRYKNWLSVR